MGTEAEMDQRFPNLNAVPVHRINSAESQAYLASLAEKAWSDNKKWAAGLKMRIAKEITKQAPMVRAAAVTSHEKFELHKAIEALQMPSHTLDEYVEFRRCCERYESWQDNRGYGDPRDAGGIPHPSRTILDAVAEQLSARGFRRTGLGWIDGAGAAIDDQSWVSLKMVRGRPRWTDPAGILEVRSRFDALFGTLLVIVERSQFAAGIAARKN